jgi:hypothetical protein
VPARCAKANSEHTNKASVPTPTAADHPEQIRRRTGLRNSEGSIVFMIGLSFEDQSKTMSRSPHVKPISSPARTRAHFSFWDAALL